MVALRITYDCEKMEMHELQGGHRRPEVIVQLLAANGVGAADQSVSRKARRRKLRIDGNSWQQGNG
jgi:hypothetical protein